MAAARGPVPKRDAERRRRNKPEVPTTSVAPVIEVVEHPAPKEHWDPIARDWYESLAVSGQSRWYEPSDWQAAQLLAESMTRLLTGERFSAQHFTAVWSGMTELLTTEGARRRVRMEIERKPSEAVAPGVAVISDYRNRLGAG